MAIPAEIGKQLRHTVRVMFDGSGSPDLVSPVDLVYMKPSKQLQEFMGMLENRLALSRA